MFMIMMMAPLELPTLLGRLHIFRPLNNSRLQWPRSNARGYTLLLAQGNKETPDTMYKLMWNENANFVLPPSKNICIYLVFRIYQENVSISEYLAS